MGFFWEEGRTKRNGKHAGHAGAMLWCAKVVSGGRWPKAEGKTAKKGQSGGRGGGVPWGKRRDLYKGREPKEMARTHGTHKQCFAQFFNEGYSGRNVIGWVPKDSIGEA